MSIESIVGSGRRLVASTLLDRCVIYERTWGPDGTGGSTETFTARNNGAARPCRFVALKDADPVINLDSNFGRAEAVLLLGLNEVFAEGDRVESNGRRWRIVSIATPPSELAVVARAGIKEE